MNTQNQRKELKTFNPVSVSSKYQICGLPIRVDSYKNCTFGCKYCFADNRVICSYDEKLALANPEQVERLLSKVYKGKADSFLERLIADGITWHYGGMSDPFQPCEAKFGITKKIVEITNRYGIHLLFSTKSDTVHKADIRPDLHTFQLSVTNVSDRRDIEPRVPPIASRLAFYKKLKSEGYKVGIRIQPFLPGVSSTDIVEMFSDADQFTIEGVKIVPQNKGVKEFILNNLGLNASDFMQKGLLNLRPEKRIELYRPLIEELERRGVPYSIADNDLRWIGNNSCCCGDRLVHKATGFDTTALIKKYGLDWTLDHARAEYKPFMDCKCNHLVTSNRQYGCKTVDDFYLYRFDKPSAPCSPLYQFKEQE